MEPTILLTMLVTASLYPVSLAFLYDSLFERRLRKLPHRVFVLVGIFILYASLILIPMGTSLPRVSMYLIVSFIILSLFRGSPLVRVCISILYYIICTALETIFLPTILIIGKTELDLLWEKPLLAILIYTLPIAFLAVATLFFARIFRNWKNQIELPVSQWLAIFLFMVFSFFELYVASMLVNSNSTFMPLLPILGVVLALMNVGLLLLLNRLTLSYKMAKENLSLQEQMRYNHLSMQTATESYEAQRSLTHDFEHHLLAIVQLLQSEQQCEALTYAQAMIAGVSKAEVAVSTNNPIADAVLNQKYRKAQELGVQMKFIVSDLSSFPLSTDEMVTVLANLLDNALEACVRDNGTQKKSIRVKLLMEPALATLSVQNTSLPVVLSHEGEVATTKEKQSEHGYGLKTCKKILQRSGFDFAVQYKDGWFQFSAIKAL